MKQKKKQYKNDLDSNDVNDERAKEMPFTAAIRNHDKDKIIEFFVQHNFGFHDDVGGEGEFRYHVNGLKQSAGEQFTGGRSTPVYHLCITKDYTNNAQQSIQKRFIIKVVEIPFPTNCSTSTSTQIDQDLIFTKYAMRVRSYDVEAGFYGRHIQEDPNHTCTTPTYNLPFPAKILTKLGLILPQVLMVERGGIYAHPYTKNNAYISFLMNDLTESHILHPDILNKCQYSAALNWLACMHARFWMNHKLFSSWSGTMLWESGSFPAIHYRLCNRKPQSISTKQEQQRQEVLWSKTMQWLKKKNPSMANDPAIQQLSKRIQACRDGLVFALHYHDVDNNISQDLSNDTNLSPVVYSTDNNKVKPHYLKIKKHGTMIHGDFKAANIFFCDSDLPTANMAAVCDFQFAGPGLGATDVTYFLFPDARTSIQSEEEESQLLDWYYSCLMTELNKRKQQVAPYTRNTLELHYRLAQVDFFAHLLSNGKWVASLQQDLRLIQVINKTLSIFDDETVLGVNQYAEVFQKAMEDDQFPVI